MRWLALTLLCLGPAALRGQGLTDEAFDAATQRGIEYVYNLDFERADSTFATLVRMRPLHPAGYFFLAMVDWWRILIDIDDERYDDRFMEALDRVVEMCDSILEVNENDVTAIFFKGGAIGFQGRLRFHRDDYLAAANAGRKALPLVQVASSLDPNNYDILLGTGIYNYYAEVIPQEYPFVKPLMLFVPPGDRRKGLEQLTRASQKARYAAVEATYFLMQVYYFYERDYVYALDLARKLHGRFPNNMLFHRYLGRAFISLGNWDAARETFGEIAARAVRGQRGYTASVEREATYYLGMDEMQHRRYDAALACFYRSDELSRQVDTKGPSGFMVMVNLKIGNIYDVQGKRDLAVSQYRKVKSMKEYRDSHEQAEKFLATPYAE